MSIIGLCGPALVGKDTIGKRLPGERLAFADKLKDESCRIAKCTRQELEDRKPEIRFFLEALGAFCRKFDPNHWINVVRDEWQAQGKPLIKITDVRHFNETEWIESEGGLVVYLHRKDVYACSDHEAKNLSEISGLPYVHHIDNNRTPEEAAADIWKLFIKRNPQYAG